jgi:signal transduction histidine kinase
MFKDLRTSTKLILLCTMFIISIAVTTYTLVVEKQIAISFARKELTGSKFLAALRPVYVAVLTNRPFNPSASELDAPVREALESFATTQSQATSALKIGAFVDALSDPFAHLTSTSQGDKSARGVDALTKLQQLASRAGDSSNLTLDTDLDTYYIQNVVVDQLPKLLGRLGELQIMPAHNSDSAISMSENKAHVLVLDGLIKSTIDEIKNNLTAAYRGSADEIVKQAVEPAYSALFSAVDAYLVGRRISILDGYTAEAAALQRNWETTVESANRAWAASQSQLDRLLELRIGGLQTRMDISLILTGALVAVSIIIAIMTYRQIVQPLERLAKVALTVRETKNYDVRVEETSDNEIGQVAAAFDGMLTELAAARDRERLEQSELARVARLTTMGVMTASIAHEINQPLSAVVSSGNAALRWLANVPPDLAEVHKLLNNIVESGHRASQTIYSVRAMFKKEEHEKEWIDLNLLIRDVLVLIQSRIQKEAISVQTDLCQNLPAVLGGRTQLQQVLMNLIANAIEAMSAVPHREKLLVIRSEVGEPASVSVSVKDTGIGIDPGNVDRIFEAFFTTKSDGMGMGLSICRSIIEGYGGRLWASAGEAEGSVFWIALPTVEASGLEKGRSVRA